MILAAADYGLQKTGTSPPEALQRSWDCQRWGCQAIFGPGPLPAWLITQMTAYANIFDAHRSDKLRTMPTDKWAEHYPQYFNIISRVQQLRMIAKSFRKWYKPQTS